MKLKLSSPSIICKIFDDLQPGAFFKLHETEKQIKGIKPEEAFILKLGMESDEGHNAVLTCNGHLYEVNGRTKVVEYAVTGVEKV